MNRNTFYAQLFVDSLIAAGLQHVCLAPGSRNTPLVLAFAARKDKIKVTSHLDERSMAFFALGLARAANTPVAIVCTSGSAAANFFPAIVEAHQSRIPLIVLTADRPPELRHSGANQTIDQVKMFGDYALWFVDTPLPEAQPSAMLLRYVQTLARRAFDTANGPRKGVVHLNMPFRPPLEPTAVEGDMVTLPAGFKNDVELPDPLPPVYYHGMDWESTWVKEIHSIHRGLIVLGPNARQMDMMRLFEFAEIMGFPVIADGTSGFRNRDTIQGYEWFLPLNLPLLQNIELVIRIGDVPTSKTLNNYLNKLTPKFYYQVAGSGDNVWADDSYKVTHTFDKKQWEGTMMSLRESFAEYGDMEARSKRERWAAEVEGLEYLTWKAIDEAVASREFEGAYVYDLCKLINSTLLTDYCVLMIGNSMPVRHIDLWGRPSEAIVYANRGASGIDGNISTALGAGAAHPDQPLVLLVGDVTFYHDMNGLLAIQRCGVPIVIVLLNNNGGGIFRTLPVKDYEPDFTAYFITPHSLDFAHAAALYGLQHRRITTRPDFRAAFTQALNDWREKKSTLIEVMTDSAVDVATRREILAAVQEKLKQPHPNPSPQERG